MLRPLAFAWKTGQKLRQKVSNNYSQLFSREIYFCLILHNIKPVKIGVKMKIETTVDARVRFVMTHKSGKVPFSLQHDQKAVLGHVSIFEGIHFALSHLPILPALAAKLKTDLIRRAIFGTAAIEGNPLSEDQVGEILEGPELHGLRDRAEQEIVNLKEAYRTYAVARPFKDGQPLVVTEQIIRDINERVTRGVEAEHHAPGLYRNHRVEVGNSEHGGVYIPPRTLDDIRILMPEFVGWINSKEVLALGGALRAALSHYHLALIHPFGDGNGRTARLLEVAMLASEGYNYIPTMLSNYYYKNMDEYYIVFRKCEKSKDHDLTAFLEFYAKGLTKSAMELQGTINSHIRLLALSDHYHKLMIQKDVNPRQHDLLMILLQDPDKSIEPATLRHDPLLAPVYRKASESTLRRDLRRLQELRLLLPSADEGLRLNQFTLG